MVSELYGWRLDTGQHGAGSGQKMFNFDPRSNKKTSNLPYDDVYVKVSKE